MSVRASGSAYCSVSDVQCDNRGEYDIHKCRGKHFCVIAKLGKTITAPQTLISCMLLASVISGKSPGKNH